MVNLTAMNTLIDIKMIITKGIYTTNNSDLNIHVLNVAYRCADYVKAKIMIVNKRNGIVYDTRYYKLYYKNITHWIKYLPNAS